MMKVEVSTRGYPFYSHTQAITGCHQKPRSCGLATGSCSLAASWLPPHCDSVQPFNTWEFPSSSSLLRHSPAGVPKMWMASFSRSSSGRLAWLITDVSFQLMGWWLPQACSATADFYRDWGNSQVLDGCIEVQWGGGQLTAKLQLPVANHGFRLTPNDDLCAAIKWIAPRTKFHSHPEEDQSIWSKRLQGS